MMVATMQQSPTTPLEIRPLMSVRDTSKFTGLSQATIWRMLNKGQITAKKLGHRTLVEGDSIRAFVDSAPKAEYRS